MEGITEIERAACTLLAHYVNNVYSQVIQIRVQEVISNPECQFYTIDGHHPNSPLVERERVKAFDYSKLERPDFAWVLDKAVVDLANSVCSYRRDGRPTGDTETRISISGLIIRSSLAANVVEFHKTVLEAYALLRS